MKKKHWKKLKKGDRIVFNDKESVEFFCKNWGINDMEPGTTATLTSKYNKQFRSIFFLIDGKKHENELWANSQAKPWKYIDLLSTKVSPKSSKCPECGGTKKVVLLFTVVPCSTCSKE